MNRFSAAINQMLVDRNKVGMDQPCEEGHLSRTPTHKRISVEKTRTIDILISRSGFSDMGVPQTGTFLCCSSVVRRQVVDRMARCRHPDAAQWSIGDWKNVLQTEFASPTTVLVRHHVRPRQRSRYPQTASPMGNHLPDNWLKSNWGLRERKPSPAPLKNNVGLSDPDVSSPPGQLFYTSYS